MVVLYRPYRDEDVPGIAQIWNEIVEAGQAFPGKDPLSEDEMGELLSAQTHCAVADVNGQVAGFYLLHPNNIGRCSHVANASYGVGKAFRSHGLGDALVGHSLRVAREQGFRGMQFNAVVVGNTVALRIYRKHGFQTVGTVPGGFELKDGTYSDMLILYRELYSGNI